MNARNMLRQFTSLLRELIAGWLWLAWLRTTTPDQFNATMQWMKSPLRLPGGRSKSSRDYKRQNGEWAMSKEIPARPHRWSGWPGAWCLDCGAEDPSEIALGDGDYEEELDESGNLIRFIFHYDSKLNECPGRRG